MTKPKTQNKDAALLAEFKQALRPDLSSESLKDHIDWCHKNPKKVSDLEWSFYWYAKEILQLREPPKEDADAVQRAKNLMIFLKSVLKAAVPRVAIGRIEEDLRKAIAVIDEILTSTM